jgi:hypothetical protein
MKKSYVLKVNEHSLYFKSLESIRKWFIECGVKDVLVSVEEEVVYSLDNLDYLVGFGEIEIENECMLERGDDYCTIELNEFEFED